MNWCRHFPNQAYSSQTYKHFSLPIFETDEFDFYRCIRFDPSFYGKTVSELHQGNLRYGNSNNRYSTLFHQRKVSYWADSIETARAEMERHRQGRNLITMWAYDDATASFPTLSTTREPLRIVDGRELGFHLILDKYDKGMDFSDEDCAILTAIEAENPDCLAYISQANKKGLNYLFFEQGFKKLVIREVRLSFRDETGYHRNCISCADTSDYTACLEAYGDFFVAKAKVKRRIEYKNSEEYQLRQSIQSYWYRQWRANHDET